MNAWLILVSAVVIYATKTRYIESNCELAIHNMTVYSQMLYNFTLHSLVMGNQGYIFTCKIHPKLLGSAIVIDLLALAHERGQLQ